MPAGARRGKLRYDVAVVGASTSGLYAAEQLARSGLSVGVFERQKELEPARRTYIITPQLRRLACSVPVVRPAWETLGGTAQPRRYVGTAPPVYEIGTRNREDRCRRRAAR